MTPEIQRRRTKHALSPSLSPLPFSVRRLPCASRCVVSLAPSLTDDGILLAERPKEREGEGTKYFSRLVCFACTAAAVALTLVIGCCWRLR